MTTQSPPTGAASPAAQPKTATVKGTLASIRALGLTATHRDGEFKVGVPGHAPADYFTDDPQDALATAQQMAAHRGDAPAISSDPRAPLMADVAAATRRAAAAEEAHALACARARQEA